jgi:hypothetical protein
MMPAQEAQASQAWHEIVCDTLKRNSIQLATYVPDNVLKPLIKAVHEDSYFKAFATTREEEAVGTTTSPASVRPSAIQCSLRIASCAAWERRAEHHLEKRGSVFSDKIMLNHRV